MKHRPFFYKRPVNRQEYLLRFLELFNQVSKICRKQTCRNGQQDNPENLRMT